MGVVTKKKKAKKKKLKLEIKTFIAHSAHVFDKPRVTVAGVVIDGILKLGVSRSSEKDIYIRKRGNDKATGRALVGSKSRTNEQSKSLEIQKDLTRKGLYAEFPLSKDPDAPVVPQFLEIANTIITQHGGVVKPRKNNNASNEEEHAVSQHN